MEVRRLQANTGVNCNAITEAMGIVIRGVMRAIDMQSLFKLLEMLDDADLAVVVVVVIIVELLSGGQQRTTHYGHHNV